MDIDYENDMRLNILNVASLCGINDVEREGYRYTATCPFCGAKRGHFYLTPVDMTNTNYKNVYRCVKCGSSGSHIKLYAELHNCSNKEAFKEILGVKAISDVENKMKKVEKFYEKSIVPMADITSKDKTYKKLISLLSISFEHRKNLLNRGLSLEQIKENGYVTLPSSRVLKGKICIKLQELGLDLKGVPGFYLDKYNKYTFWTPKEGGFLVPVRDIYGRIQGCQIRKNGINVKKKYPWFSSGYMEGGCQSTGFFHVKWNKKHSSEKVFITEGPLKATIASILSDVTSLAVPGVGTYKGCADVLNEMKSKTIFLAYDMDKYSNEKVMEHQHNLYIYLKKSGFNDVKISEWNPKFKGIDDYLNHIKCSKNGTNINYIVN